jgi:hypothetical protein
MDPSNEDLMGMGGDAGELREQDRFLPIANVARIMKKGIPSEQGKIAKDARECVQGRGDNATCLTMVLSRGIMHFFTCTRDCLIWKTWAIVSKHNLDVLTLCLLFHLVLILLSAARFLTFTFFQQCFDKK